MQPFFLRAEEMRLRRVRQRVRAFVDLAGDKDQTGAVAGRWAMITATYADGGDWRAHHISQFIDTMAHHLSRRGHKLVYVWVAELQKRGAVHYHIAVKLPKDEQGEWVTLPKPDEKGWWKHGSTNIDWIRKTGKHYMAKYTSKESQKRGVFMKGLRLCGAGGLPAAARAWWRFLLAPRYVRHECTPADSPQRVDGGWKLRSDGTFIPTPYICTPMPEYGGVYLEKRSADDWVNAVVEHSPHKVWQARHAVARWCERFVCEAWKKTGLDFDNPFAGWLPEITIRKSFV